jgi:hypothetical protein
LKAGTDLLHAVMVRGGGTIVRKTTVAFVTSRFRGVMSNPS